jgi:Domain of Unknown Function (DUF1259)
MIKKVPLITLSAVILAAFLFGSTFTGSSNSAAFASSDTLEKCKDAAAKISDKAEASVSNDVCGIELSRDSPTLKLKDKQINEQVPMEFPYQPASASSNSKVLSIVEFTLLQSEVDQVNQYLLDNHWTVTAIHNHHFDENPRLIYLHAQKQDNLDDVLKEIRNALEKTSCDCT